MIPKAGTLTRLLKSFLVGLAGSITRNGLPVLSVPPEICDEWQRMDRSEADCRVRTLGTVAYTYSGPIIGLDQGGILNRTPTWKTVLDRDLRNRCIEGTGWDGSET